MARRYYLTHPTARSTDTIYVLPAGHPDEAYLLERIGAERITRAAALRVDATHRHTGRGSAWCRSDGMVHQADASGYDSAATLRAVIDDACDGTLEMIREYRALDEG
jgi:hypothetical protein